MAKRYALLKDPVIQAVLHGYYRFADEAQAIRQLEIIKSRFYISRHADHPDTPTGCTFWIKGYDLTDDEKAQGCTGNFARVECARHEREFGFAVRKIPMPPGSHPQKRRSEQRHPNWGHPILRGIEKKHLYPALQEAQNALTLLQQEYPHAAVPGEHSLSLMIYGRAEDKKARRVKRYELGIKPLPEGGYIIECAYKAPKPSKANNSPPPQPVGEPVGFFTAKVTLKRKKKK